jgi:uncharacterized protein YgiM (DUF1202 family)
MRKLLIPLMLASSLAMAEPGTLTKDSVLHAQPGSASDTVGTLKGKTAVEIITRQGAWAQIKANDLTGWVRIFDVSTGSSQKGDSGVGALASMFKTGSTGTTVSTGVKGLSGEDLTNARPDPAEEAKLNKYISSSGDASQGARQVKLSPQNVSFLPEVKK